MSKRFRERGAITVLLALLLVVMLGFVGLALDMGYVFVIKNELQNAADAGALKCAEANSVTPGSCTTGTDTSKLNEYNVTLTVPVTCPQTTQSNCVQATTTNTWNTFFIQLFGINSLTRTATAIAGTGQQSSGCLLGLATSGTTVQLSPSGTLNLSCLVESNSTNNKSVTIGGGGTITSTSGITTSGKIQGSTSGFSGSILTNQASTTDPYASLTPPTYGSCQNITTNLCGQTLNPATYCTLDINPPGGCTTTLTSGTYVVTSGLLNIHGAGGSTINGSGVTFYLPNGSTMNSAPAASVNLSAPTSGPLANILFWQPAANTQNAQLNGSGNISQTYKGVFYAPSGQFTLNTSTQQVTIGAIIANSIVINNSGGVLINNSGVSSGSSPSYPILLQ